MAAPVMAMAATPAAASKAERIKPTPLSKDKITGLFEPRQDGHRRVGEGRHPEGAAGDTAHGQPGHAPVQQGEADPRTLHGLGDDRRRDIVHGAIDQDDPETHFQLSRLYNLIGDAVLAKQHLETFQKIKNKKAQ